MWTPCKAVILVCSHCQSPGAPQRRLVRGPAAFADNRRLLYLVWERGGVCACMCLSVHMCVLRPKTTVANVSYRKAQFIEHTLKVNFHCERQQFVNFKHFYAGRHCRNHSCGARGPDLRLSVSTS